MDGEKLIAFVEGRYCPSTLSELLNLHDSIRSSLWIGGDKNGGQIIRVKTGPTDSWFPPVKGDFFDGYDTGRYFSFGRWWLKDKTNNLYVVLISTECNQNGGGHICVIGYSVNLDGTIAPWNYLGRGMIHERYTPRLDDINFEFVETEIPMVRITIDNVISYIHLDHYTNIFSQPDIGGVMYTPSLNTSIHRKRELTLSRFQKDLCISTLMSTGLNYGLNDGDDRLPESYIEYPIKMFDPVAYLQIPGMASSPEVALKDENVALRRTLTSQSATMAEQAATLAHVLVPKSTDDSTALRAMESRAQAVEKENEELREQLRNMALSISLLQRPARASTADFSDVSSVATCPAGRASQVRQSVD